MNNEERREEYWYSRLKWAREHEEDVLNMFKEAGEKAGAELDAAALERLRRRCIEELKFSYPAEHEFSEIATVSFDGISKDDILPYAYELFKSLRAMHEQEKKA